MTPEQRRAARKMLGWTQRELARQAHVTRAGVEGFEDGQSRANRVSSARRQLALLEAGKTTNALDDGASGCAEQKVDGRMRGPG